MTWTAHSHRRTFATVAMEAGVLEEIVGRLLNDTLLESLDSGMLSAVALCVAPGDAYDM